jgi:hypothetical protein
MIQLLTSLNMPLLSKTVITVRSGLVPFKLDNSWTLKMDFCDGIEKGEILGELGDFWIFQFPP